MAAVLAGGSSTSGYDLKAHSHQNPWPVLSQVKGRSCSRNVRAGTGEALWICCGSADSKKLTEDRRDELFDVVKKETRMGWAVDSSSPQDLSAQMLSR